MNDFGVVMDDSAGRGVAESRVKSDDIGDFRLEDHIDVPTDIVADVVEVEPTPGDLQPVDLVEEPRSQKSERVDAAVGLGSVRLFEFVVGIEPFQYFEVNGVRKGGEREGEYLGFPIGALHTYMLPTIWYDPAKEMNRAKRAGRDRSFKDKKD